MYKARANERNFEIVNNSNVLTVDGSPLAWDVKEISDGYFHLLIGHKSYRAEIVKADHQTKSFTIKVNGKIFTVELKDKFDLLLDKMGMNNGLVGKANTVKAPMPGLIIDLRVKEGDHVKAGDVLLILEAMKMENMIKAATESVIKSVSVVKGDSVEKNQVLIEFNH